MANLVNEVLAGLEPPDHGRVSQARGLRLGVVDLQHRIAERAGDPQAFAELDATLRAVPQERTSWSLGWLELAHATEPG